MENPDSISTESAGAPCWLDLTPMTDASHDLAEVRRAYVGAVWSPTEAVLPPRIRELVTVVTLTFRGYPTVREHLRRAIDAGASFREIVEALQVVSIPGGFPCLHYAMVNGLMDIQEELGGEAGQAELAPPSTTAGHSSSAWPWAEEYYPEYQAARSRFLSFIWEPEQPVLPMRYRELLASMILAYRAYPTINDHFSRALREGATLDEMVEALHIAALVGGQPLLHFALPILADVHAQVETAKAN